MPYFGAGRDLPLSPCAATIIPPNRGNMSAESHAAPSSDWQILPNNRAIFRHSVPSATSITCGARQSLTSRELELLFLLSKWGELNKWRAGKRTRPIGRIGSWAGYLLFYERLRRRDYA